ncbi:CaiB/BaiF CoA transferase family protein [Bordetella petrii]|uniref:CaiB/BaiF CoA transferase family protein n=1 Tax=Bordetella petrii TaxID=94624 RepID=UPI00372ECCD7
MSDAQGPAKSGPLTALRVLDLGTMVAGPVAATLMGDFGADVIKIEQPGVGDTIRGLGPFVNEEGLWWTVEGRNKRSITLDLRQAAGQDLLKRLVAGADVLVENFRPGTLERWGLDYDALARVNPGLVMLSVSGFGQTGPNAQRAGYDRIALAFSGVMDMTGFPDRPPVRVGVSVADYSTATMGAFAVMMALYHRDTGGGRGQHIDLALYESMFRFTDSMCAAYDRLGMVRKRTGNVHQAAAPGKTFPTRDGRYIILTISGDTLFRRLMQAIDRPDLGEDPGLATHEQRWRRIEELNQVVEDWIAARPVDAVGQALDRHGIPFSLVLSVEDIFRDPHYAARGNLVTTQHPRMGPVTMQGIVPRLSGTPGEIACAAPSLGQHNAEVYGGLLGLDDAALAALQERAVI